MFSKFKETLRGWFNQPSSMTVVPPVRQKPRWYDANRPATQVFHAPNAAEDGTLCGLKIAKDLPFEFACDCGPHCGAPVDCPDCLRVRQMQAA